MTKPSRSSERHTFQVNAYIERCREEGKEPSQAYIDMYENDKKADLEWANDKDHSFDMEWDLRTTQWILDKARASESYAQNLYAAMCNNEFQKNEVWPTLKNQRWSCTWRYAGGIIADMRQEGDYIDWYCSGISGGDEPDVYLAGEDLKRKSFVPESVVTDEIREDLKRLGWIVIDEAEDLD